MRLLKENRREKKERKKEEEKVFSREFEGVDIQLELVILLRFIGLGFY